MRRYITEESKAILFNICHQIEEDFGKITLTSKNQTNITTRCTVFYRK